MKYRETDGKPPAELRSFNDFGAFREDIFESARKTLEESFPKKWGGKTLSLSETRYIGPKTYTLREQRDALNEGKDLKRRLKGKLTLTDDESGKVLDEQDVYLMDVPYLTDRGTFINGGNEYVSLRQSRLRPGVYTRRRDNGQVEAQFNTRRGTGADFRLILQPDTGVFKLKLGQNHINLYSLMKDLGYDDSEMEKAWGKEVFEVNKDAYNARDINSAFNRFANIREIPKDKELSRSERLNLIKEGLNRAEVDYDITSRNIPLNEKTASAEDNKLNLSLPLILSASKKVLDINKGITEPDERDALYYKRIMNTSDLIAERIKLDADGVGKKLMFKVANQGSLKNFPSGIFNNYTKGMIVGNSLSSPLEEINPIQLLEQAHRITGMGQGGIGTSRAITSESQNVHPSQFGFYDVIAGPECYDDKTYVLTESGWKLFKECCLEDKFACLIAGKQEFHNPWSLIQKDYDGYMIVFSNKKINACVTENHRIWALEYDDLDDVWGFSYAANCFMESIRIKGQDGSIITVGENDWCKELYNGIVYCATVPGGLVLVKRNDCTPFWCGNSEKAGVDVRAAYQTRISKDGKLYQRFYDKKNKEYVWMSPEDFGPDDAIAFRKR